MFKAFTASSVQGPAGRLHTLCGGQGAPLLLLHGHPQSHVMWHAVADKLAGSFTVVMMDLRGYGDSERVASDDFHRPYSKRAMALDAIAVMRYYGFDTFAVLAHDRGARVAHRLAVDHPGAVKRLMLLDIAPTLGMYEHTTDAFARAYWHWFFLIQPPPLPESLIDSNPVRYVRSVMGNRHAGLSVFLPTALAEYERCAQIPGTGKSICEDYRAAATIDLEHDRADVAGGVRLAQPLRVLWGDHGAVGKCFDVLGLWHERASHVCGRSLPCGHYIAEEAPALLMNEASHFFKD